ncbi:Cof-type HAD-IIB family hydrolase [Coriobacterium glomerans]|nr:Cof-type HAD-IIB family hydrolase [Coriobacterium glomerans]
MIVFSDLDGTLLTAEKTITERTFSALDALARAGHRFVPCTGRAATRIDTRLIEHPAASHIISANGASIYDTVERRLLRRICLGRDRALALLELRADRDVTFDIFADGACYTERRNYERLDVFISDPYTLQSMRESRTPFDGEVPAFIDSLDQIERIAMYWHDANDRDYLLPNILSDPSVSCVRSYPTNIEVSDAGATKGAALLWLCGHLGIPVADSVAFGDNINDISMVRAAGIGFAMGNAEQEVSAAADEICLSNEEDGVARAIQALIAGRRSDESEHQSSVISSDGVSEMLSHT